MLDRGVREFFDGGLVMSRQNTAAAVTSRSPAVDPAALPRKTQLEQSIPTTFITSMIENASLPQKELGKQQLSKTLLCGTLGKAFNDGSRVNIDDQAHESPGTSARSCAVVWRRR